ncbi:MAG: stage III sporulation protein AF [Cellulosilyticaceae bacterium]
MKEYLQTLIWTMLFIVVVEMIFPVSELKKYIKFVLGFIILYTILLPVITGIQKIGLGEEISVMNYINFYQSNLEQGITSLDYEKNYDRQVEGMKEIYENQLILEIEQRLEKKLDIDVSDIVVETNYEGGSYKILEIEMVVCANDDRGFRIEQGNKNESIVLSEERLKKEIKNFINDFYNLDNSNIHIIVQDN